MVAKFETFFKQWTFFMRLELNCKVAILHETKYVGSILLLAKNGKHL